MKPEYRFSFQITDDTESRVIISGTTFISDIDSNGTCESIELEIVRALRAFRNEKKYHEKRYYKTDEEEKELIKEARRITQSND